MTNLLSLLSFTFSVRFSKHQGSRTPYQTADFVTEKNGNGVGTNSIRFKARSLERGK